MMKEFGRTGALLLLPSLMGFLLLYILPFLWGLRYSVSRSGFDDAFVGLSNYRYVIHSPSFRLALKNNLVFLAIGIPLLIVISFLLALLVYEVKASPWVKLAIVLPIAIPSASVSGFFREFMATGIHNLMDSDLAMVSVIILFIWRSTGYNLLVYLAALGSMDQSLLESALMDGASYRQRVQHVILPALTPATVFVSILSIINSYRVYKDVFILQGNYPNSRIYMLQHYMNNQFAHLQYQNLTAAAFLFVLLIFGVALIFFYVDHRYHLRTGGSH
jgi:multiple sugar transport system permease protein